MVLIKMKQSTMCPSLGLLNKGQRIDVPLDHAVYLIHRDKALVADGSNIVDITLSCATLSTIANHYAQSSAVEDALSGVCKGHDVHVIGTGPSASKFLDADIPEGDMVIACNAAIRLVKPDVALVVEGVSVHFDWFDDVLAFDGMKVLDVSVSCMMTSRREKKYTNRYWQDILWFRRRAYDEGEDLSKMGAGLVYIQENGVIRGTVVAQGAHLAQIMDADAVHMWGVELYFPDGKQNFCGTEVYLPGTSSTSVQQFGDKMSTQYFTESAYAIKKIARGIPLIDHSDGLLSL